MSARRPWILVCALLALGLGACATKIHHDADSNNDGVYVDAGPVTYQLQISRELNQYNIEDAAYLAGLPKGTAPLAADELWYGVFLWAKNQTHHTEMTADNFDIVDTQGNKYYPMALNPSLNSFVWTAQSLQPSATEPAPNSVASEGPTQGSLLLFRLNTSVYANRPLDLEIRSPSGQLWGTISLDL